LQCRVTHEFIFVIVAMLKAGEGIMHGITGLIARVLMAAGLAAGSLLSLRASAHAYDINDCNRVVDTFAIQQFSIEGGGVDFGDLPHLAGNPVGTAVVCWSPGGRVAIIGKLFADDLCLPFQSCIPLTATATITFRRTNGQTSTITQRVLSQGNLAYGEIKRVSAPGNFNQVKVQLFHFQSTPLGSTGNVPGPVRTFQR
jgi:hypothetical protein